jgi:hypothetical protein
VFARKGPNETPTAPPGVGSGLSCGIASPIPPTLSVVVLRSLGRRNQRWHFAAERCPVRPAARHPLVRPSSLVSPSPLFKIKRPPTAGRHRVVARVTAPGEFPCQSLRHGTDWRGRRKNSAPHRYRTRRTRRVTMTSKQLPGVTAIVSRRDSRDGYRPKGWREALLEILRADATNIDYLLPRHCRQ